MSETCQAYLKLLVLIVMIYLLLDEINATQDKTAIIAPNTYELEQCSIYRGQDEIGNHYFIRCNREEPKEIETEYG